MLCLGLCIITHHLGVVAKKEGLLLPSTEVASAVTQGLEEDQYYGFASAASSSEAIDWKFLQCDTISQFACVRLLFIEMALCSGLDPSSEAISDIGSITGCRYALLQSLGFLLLQSIVT